MKMSPFPFAGLALAVAAALAPIAASAETPVTPNASPQAKGLLNWLFSIQGNNIVSGQQEDNAAAGTNNPLTRIFNLTGKYPGIVGFDYADISPDLANPQADNPTQRALTWSQNNGVVTISWHWNIKGPNNNAQVYYKVPYGQAPFPVTDFDVSQAVIPGTAQNIHFLHDIDVIATELKTLRNNNVPVLWRPFHEGSTDTFWWGAKGPVAFKKAWRIMFERLVSYHGLNNLVWVYTPSYAADLGTWYPGDEYVDIVGMDIYPESGHPTSASTYNTVKAFTGIGKLVTMSENGALPDTSQLAAQGANWSGFLTWRKSDPIDPEYNTDAYLTSTFNASYVLTRDELPTLSTLTSPAIGSAIRLMFTRRPTDVYLGDSWASPVYVAAVDSNDRVVRTYNGSASFKYDQEVTTVQLTNGVARYDKKFDTIAANKMISVTSAGLLPLYSNYFSIGTSTDTAAFNFESSAKGWYSEVGTASLSALHAYAGGKSLQVPLTGATTEVAAKVFFNAATGVTPPTGGRTLQFRVWVPEGSNIDEITAYSKDGSWNTTRSPTLNHTVIAKGTWSTLSVQVPANMGAQAEMGVSFKPETGKAMNGNVFIDSVSW